MASVLVAGRVSEECKERADYYIRRAGLTASEVIRIVWENIARTGEVPHAIEPNPNEDASWRIARSCVATTSFGPPRHAASFSRTSLPKA